MAIVGSGTSEFNDFGVNDHIFTAAAQLFEAQQDEREQASSEKRVT